MFWKSITDGICVFFTTWEIWVVILIYGLISLAYYLKVTAPLRERTHGCFHSLITSLSGSLFIAIIVTTIITFTMPILIGVDGINSFSFIGGNWQKVMQAGYIVFIVVFGLTLFPNLSNLLDNAIGVDFFIQGALGYHILAQPMVEYTYGQLISKSVLFKGGVFLGFIGFSIVIGAAIMYGLIAVLMRFLDEKYAIYIANFLRAFTGMLLLCIYTSFIRLTLIAPLLH